MASTTSAAAAATSSAAAQLKGPSNLKVVGVILAISSGVLIGSSFVFKKRGLLASQKGHVAGEGVAYLKSPLWWLGMIMMICGELCNFVAYAFTEAVVVTPMGALSVVICAILSSIFLNEKLSVFGWLGCALCILGSTIIALNAPSEQSIGQIREFEKLFIAPGFLAYIGVLIAISLSVMFYFGPKHGDKNMMWYISVCSLIGGISVSVTTGLGAAIVTTAMGGGNQFKYWFIYFLLVFVVVTLLTEVFYLNKALALFNTAMVTPTYYVCFTFCSLVTTVVLFQGLKASVAQILTIVFAFFSICIGITILQMSKVDPTQLKKLDRRSTMLLQAARSQTQAMDEKDISGVEDPGIDALRGSFGAFGSIIRAKSARRMSMNSRASLRARHPATDGEATEPAHYGAHNHYPGMKRHQLYDAPMPPPPGIPRSPGSERGSVLSGRSAEGGAAARNPTIKFGSQDLVHTYEPPGAGASGALAVHEFQTVRAHNRAVNPSLSDSTVATLGVGERYSNFLSMASPGTESELGTPRAFPQGLPPSGGPSFLVESPRTDLADPLTAPASQDAFHHPRAEDPYARGPASAGLPTTHSSIDSVGSLDALAASSDDEDSRGPGAPRNFFGRPPSSPRRYPGARGDDDGEESRRLWKRSDDDLPEGGHGPPSLQPGAIRLVRPPTGSSRF